MELPAFDIVHKAISISHSCTIQQVTFSRPLPPDITTAILKTRANEDFQQNQSEKRIYERVSPRLDLYPRLYHVKAEERKHIMQFVVEYCEEGDLQTWTEKEKGVTRGQAFNLLKDISKALKELHSLGISHNQVFPSNVLLTKGQFKLGGFGGAKELSYESIRMNPLSKTSNPPEFSEDVFNLGVTFLQYFAQNPDLSVKEADQTERFQLVEKYLRNFEASWRLTIKTMLLDDPNQRISAANAYEHFASQPNSSIPYSVDTSVSQSESLDHTQMNALINRDRESSPRTSFYSQSLPASSEPLTNRTYGEDVSHLFVVALEPFAIIMQHQLLEEAFLRTKLSQVMGLLNEHRGAVAANLDAPVLKCNNALCGRESLAYQMCPLAKCGHVLCKDCFNQSLTRQLQDTTGVPEFKCFICYSEFDVLSKPLEAFIYPLVMAAIRELVLASSTVRSPCCHFDYDISPLNGPRTVYCPCGKKFCSYCLKPKRHLIRCSKWARDQKTKKR